MELATPITIYWDLPSETADVGFLLRVCDEITACLPLMLHLRESGPCVGVGTYAVLERLAGAPMAVSLTMPAASFEVTGRTLYLSGGVKEILLGVDLPTDNPLPLTGNVGNGGGVGGGRPTLGISLVVTRENWRELPGLIASCRERGISRLVLPMQRLYDGDSPFLLTRDEQQGFADALAVVGGGAGMNLTIHDPFLWRAFHPGVPFPQGGCQGANTMLAVAPDGAVYPCPALPVLLGRIGDASLREIVASAEKKEVRRALLQHPASCRGCGELAECRGGCRGRAYVVHGFLDGADPACG